MEVTIACHGAVLEDHDRRLDSSDRDMHQMREGHGDIAEMFGKIMAATTLTANQVLALDTSSKALSERVDKGFAQARLDQDRVCALKHGALEQRIGTVEQGKIEIAKRVEDMGDNTKLTYIHNLEAQRDDALKVAGKSIEHKFEWRKLWFAAVIGLVMALVGAGLTYAVGVAAHKTEAKPAPGSSSVVVR